MSQSNANRILDPRERVAQRRYQQEIQRKHKRELRAFEKAVQKADPTLVARFRNHLQFHRLISNQCPKLWEENVELARRLRVVEAELGNREVFRF